MTIKSFTLATTIAMTAGVANAQEMRTVDSNYGPIEVPVLPERVYVDGPWTLGNVLALGVTPLATVVYGESNIDYMGDLANGVDQLSYGDEGVSIETIATYDPDLIIIREWRAGAKEERCGLAGEVTSTFCYTGEKYTIEIVHNILRNTASALNKTDEAGEIIATMNTRIADLKSRVEALGLDEQTVSVIRIRPDEYEFAGPMAPMMIRAVGLTVPEGQYVPYPEPEDFDWDQMALSLENLDRIGADYLFINVDLDNDGKLDALQSNPLYPILPAVQNDQVFLVETGVWNSFDVLAMNTVLDQIEEFVITPAEQTN